MVVSKKSYGVDSAVTVGRLGEGGREVGHRAKSKGKPAMVALFEWKV